MADEDGASVVFEEAGVEVEETAALEETVLADGTVGVDGLDDDVLGDKDAEDADVTDDFGGFGPEFLGEPMHQLSLHSWQH